MSFNSVEDIVKAIITWEKDFDSFYSTLEEYLKDEKSRKAAEVLQLRHEKILKELESIDLEKYGHIEFVKYVPEYSGEDRFEIAADAAVEDLFYKILDHEEKRIEYYRRLRNIVVFEKSRELFDMLIQLKTGQAKEIKALLDSYNLAM
ncbi:MAG: hypothetical protein A3C36_05080 [Omnitrophica WOR_2 bacterium RIFCSPHIGHO2_02_FULL_52_10]|nr:MAG: hypothetical protein A3C36_05080 [Omnitrophica WOR_2 bacterium RIFCSPHIGHO2_02_FULL_52_10]